MARYYITALAIVGCAYSAAAKSFMRRPDTREEVEASLLAELAGTFRPSATKTHIISLETELRPMYNAVPQEADGSLRHTVVRYVLHRMFAKRGWFIRGLEPGTGGNEKKNTTSGDSLQDLQEWVPSFLQGFLEQLAGGRGISLRELAVLAATLEDLIHKETINRLEVAFNALELPVDKKVDEEHIVEVLEVFMMIYLLGERPFTVKGRQDVQRAHKVFAKKVKDWTEVQEWMHGVREKVFPGGAALDFESMGRVVEEIGANYGTYNKKECGSLKSELMSAESKKAGRITLADFYKKGKEGVFELNEKIDYLRTLGAIDESDPKQPHVIISNYVGSRPNCLLASKFYVVCCTNECEDLMGKLENSIAGEMASPEQILDLVSSFSTPTVVAPRKISSTLTQRLQGIAQSNGGQVPLHGRLFAQWMHHAFPRECPFPHEDLANPQTPDEWMKETGQKLKASDEEIMSHISKLNSESPKGEEAREHHSFAENELPWSNNESLLSPFSRSSGQTAKPRSSLKSMAVFALLFSMASGFVWATKPYLSGADFRKPLPQGGDTSVNFVKNECKMA